MSTTNTSSSTTNRTGLRSSANSTLSHLAPSTSSSTLRNGLKRDREISEDHSLPNTKRHLRTTLNDTLSSSALESKLAILQANCADLEKKVRDRDQRLDLLEKDRRWLHDRETEERETREREGQEASQREAQLKRDLSTAQISLSNLEVSHADLKDAHLNLQRTRSHEVNLLKTRLEEVQKQANLLEARVEEEKNAAKANAASELSSSISAPSSLSQSTSSPNIDHDHRLLTAELQRQATYSRQLQSTNTRLNADLVVLKNENATLRERNATVEVLREDKRGLESRLKMKEEEIEKLVRKMEELRRSHAQPSSSRRSSSAAGQLPLNPSTLAQHLGLDQDEEDVPMEDDVDDTHPTVKATSELASLRLEYATLLDAHGTTLAELTAVKRERDALMQDKRDISLKQQKPEKESDRVELSNLRIQLRLKDDELQTALKELTFLEVAVTQLTSDTTSQSDPGTITSSLHSSRIQQLEGLLNDAKRSNAELRSEIESLLEKLKRVSEQQAELEERVLKQTNESKQKEEKSIHAVQEELAKTKADLQEEIKKGEELEKSLDTVEQTLFDLRGEIAGGRHIPPNTRILEMKDNPHAEWESSRTAVLERLKGENQALLKRLAEVEDASKETPAAPAPTPVPNDASHEALVPRESLDLAVKEREELQKESTQRERRLLRLQQVFKAKSAEFREAIESIMGVKLAFYPNGQVRVTSLYDLNASFVFSPDKSAKLEPDGMGMKMQLVAKGEGGPQDLPNMMRYWIETEACIPGFMASVTLECYDCSKKDQG